MIIKSQLLRGLFGIEKETLADLCFTLDNLSIVKTLFKSGSNIFSNIATKLKGEVVDRKKELKEYEDFISNSLNWHRNAAINNFCEILDIKDYEKIDSVREIDDICQSIENKAIVAQKELNKKFKGKNIIDFQIYNIQLVEKSFSKIDKDDRKVIGESMDKHLTILSKKGKTFKEPINKVKSNFGVKDFKYKSIKKILKNEDYLKKLLVTDDEQGKLIRFILSEIVISIGKSLVDKTKFYGTLMASSTALLFVFTGGLEALLAGGFTGVLDRVRGKKAKMTILCYSVFLLSLNSLETLDPFDEIKEYLKEHNKNEFSLEEEVSF
jgi:hypothetical protein|tara:strand:- start:200 stop:1171 length:972 start_codon:yes stop_codon:yes gene_type:complete